MEMKKPDKMKKLLLLNKIADSRNLIKQEACAHERRELCFYLEDLEQDLLGMVKEEKEYIWRFGGDEEEAPVLEGEYNSLYPENYRLR